MLSFWGICILLSIVAAPVYTRYKQCKRIFHLFYFPDQCWNTCCLSQGPRFSPSCVRGLTLWELPFPIPMILAFKPVRFLIIHLSLPFPSLYLISFMSQFLDLLSSWHQLIQQDRSVTFYLRQVIDKLLKLSSYSSCLSLLECQNYRQTSPHLVKAFNKYARKLQTKAKRA